MERFKVPINNRGTPLQSSTRRKPIQTSLVNLGCPLFERDECSTGSAPQEGSQNASCSMLKLIKRRDPISSIYPEGSGGLSSRARGALGLGLTPCLKSALRKTALRNWMAIEMIGIDESFSLTCFEWELHYSRNSEWITKCPLRARRRRQSFYYEWLYDIVADTHQLDMAFLLETITMCCTVH